MDRIAGPITHEEKLPNFLIIGMAKSGTSSLYAYLGQYPQVYTSPRRAPNFFGLGEQDSLSYNGPVRSFPPVAPTLVQYGALFAGVLGEIARGEGSSFFNFTPRAAMRIHHYVPKARLLLILRQPAERAYSQYLYARRMGWEPECKFEAALAQEPKRHAMSWFPFLCYRQSSMYAATLRVFLDLFPREQLRVCLFDDFRRDPAGIVRNIYGFLGVDPAFVPDVSVNCNPAHVGAYPWLRSAYNRPAVWLKRFIPGPVRRLMQAQIGKRAPAPKPLAASLRIAMTREFSADICATQELIERDLSHWLNADER